MRKVKRSRGLTLDQIYLSDSIEEKGISPLKSFFTQLGNWPVVEGDNWDETSWTWQDIIEKATQEGLLINFPFSLSTFTETLKNSTKTILRVSIIVIFKARQHIIRQCQLLNL